MEKIKRWRPSQIDSLPPNWPKQTNKIKINHANMYYAGHHKQDFEDNSKCYATRIVHVRGYIEEKTSISELQRGSGSKTDFTRKLSGDWRIEP